MPNPPLIFGTIRFREDFSEAERADGTRVGFTRAERRVLADLVRHAGSLRTRGQLLDACGEVGSDASERTIDFVVTRVRAKLGDPARKPLFIATRYGEGYVWVARPAARMAAAPRAFLIVGPLRSVGTAAGRRDEAAAFADALVAALRRRMPDDQPVVLVPDPEDADAPAAALRLTLTFVGEAERTDCVSALTTPAGATVHHVRRDRLGRVDADAVAESHIAALWRSRVEHGGPSSPDSPPLAVRMAEAGALLGTTGDEADLPEALRALKGEAFPPAAIWRRNEAALRQLLREGRATAGTRLMLAVNIQTRYVIDGWRFLAHRDPRADDMRELQALLLDDLPALSADPDQALAAAGVLTFMGEEYQALALDIAEEAFGRSTSIASALATLGPLRCFSGDFSGGLPLLEEARRLCPPGSVFERYVLSYICQNRLAAGDFEGKDRDLELLTRSPLSKGPYRMVYATPGTRTPTLPVRLHMALMPRRYAAAALLWSYWICARLYRTETARANVITGLAGLMTRRFGDEIVPEEVRRAVPAIGRAASSTTAV